MFSLRLGKVRKRNSLLETNCQIQLEVMECRQMGIPMGRKHWNIFQRSSEKMNLKLKLWKEIHEVVSCYWPFLLFKQKMDTQKSGENQQQTAQSNLLGSWSVTSIFRTLPRGSLNDPRSLALFYFAMGHLLFSQVLDFSMVVEDLLGYTLEVYQELSVTFFPRNWTRPTQCSFA